MNRYGSELQLVSRVSSDGKSLENDGCLQKDGIYELRRLSITQETYIASAFSTFIVKLKNPPK